MLYIPLTSYHLLVAKHEPYQKAQLLTEKIEEFSGGNQENGPIGEKNKKERERECVCVCKSTEPRQWNKRK